MIDNLLLGLDTMMSLHNLWFAFLGVLLGNIVGILPGIGTMAAIAMLLPITYALSPMSAVLLIAGLYYGANFGGATTSILLNLPGTPSHAVVCLEGHTLARKGKGGPAIFMAMFASFIGVLVGIICMSFFSPLLSDFAFNFGPSEYASLVILGLIAASMAGQGSIVENIASVVFGLILGVVGTDVNSGIDRFTFGSLQLSDGISLLALAMGYFGLKDVLENAGVLSDDALLNTHKIDRRTVRPDKNDLVTSANPILRGSLLGGILGILPGAGATIASFISYAIEKRVSPDSFGHGAIQGVSGPESANSSASITAYIPTLTLGIPGDPVMALVLGALMIQNITPGPQLITGNPELFWGLIASFWIGNIMLLVLNIPMIGLWVRLLRVPYRIIYPAILFLIVIGVFSETNELFSIAEVLVIGIVAYLGKYIGLEGAPLLLGLVLGPMLEENIRRALLLSQGDFSIFINRPLSAIFLGVTISLLAMVIFSTRRRKKIMK